VYQFNRFSKNRNFQNKPYLPPSAIDYHKNENGIQCCIGNNKSEHRPAALDGKGKSDVTTAPMANSH
jgi:hypothetical protein